MKMYILFCVCVFHNHFVKTYGQKLLNKTLHHDILRQRQFNNNLRETSIKDIDYSEAMYNIFDI